MPPSLAQNTKDSEYMSAMLMGWYMSGYYTGLYHGRKEAQEEIASLKMSHERRSKSPQGGQQRKKHRKRNS